MANKLIQSDFNKLPVIFQYLTITKNIETDTLKKEPSNRNLRKKQFYKYIFCGISIG